MARRHWNLATPCRVRDHPHCQDASHSGDCDVATAENNEFSPHPRSEPHVTNVRLINRHNRMVPQKIDFETTSRNPRTSCLRLLGALQVRVHADSPPRACGCPLQRGRERFIPGAGMTSVHLFDEFNSTIEGLGLGDLAKDVGIELGVDVGHGGQSTMAVRVALPTRG